LLFLACAARPTIALSDAQVVDEFKALHEPVYGVYQLSGDRHAVHGLLRGSFTGDELTREYVEHWTTLAHMEREQTSIRVKTVDYKTVEVLDRVDDEVRVEVDWSVGGVVTHQEHKHPRVNRYRAVYTMIDTGEGLRITATRMRNLERIKNALSTTDEGLLIDELDGGGGGFMDPLELLELMEGE